MLTNRENQKKSIWYIYISIDFRGWEGGESKNQIISTDIPTILSKIVARIFSYSKCQAI